MGKIKVEATQIASPTGSSQFKHGGQSNRSTTRQFTTRSRAKSTASFKGLRKVLTHDGTTIDRDSMKPTKSSDALFRKRAISGLNMTALARVRSNPNVLHGGSGSHGHGTAGMWMGIPGIKPRRTKSTHSVISTKDTTSDSNSSSDEEYISENEEVIGPDSNNRPDNNSDEDDNIGRRKIMSIDSIMEESQIEKSPEDILTDKAHVIKPLSYKPPSDYIDPGNISANPDKFNDSQNDTSLELEIKTNGINRNELKPTTGANSSEKKQELQKGPELSISNDHIEQTTTDITDNNEGYDLYRNQLTRQNNTNNKEYSQHDGIPVQQNNKITQEDNINNELADQYIPNMILSQSTGVVRRFDEPPSIQNSLANEIHANRNPNYIISNNNNDNHNIKNNNTDNGYKLSSDHTNSRERKSSIHQVPKELAKKMNKFNTNDDTINPNPNADTATTQSNNGLSNFSNSYSSLTNNLQRANAAAVLGKTASARVPQSRNRQTNSTGSQTSSTPLSVLFRKKSNQDPKLNLRDSKLHGDGKMDTTESKSKINNFSEFLKSDMTEDDSRTQRKLWLQRENSIMDLSIQNGSADSIFMITDIDVKREFERISHEYTNSKRFYNPLDASLNRFENFKRQQAATNKETNTKNRSKDKSGNNDNSGNKLLSHMSVRSTDSKANKANNSSNGNGNDFFVGYGSGQPNTVNMEEFLPSAQNTKLQRVLSSIWKEESMTFNNEVNPLNKNNNGHYQRELGDGSQSRLSQANNMGPRSTYNNNYLKSMNQSNANSRPSLRNTMMNGANNANNFGNQSRLVNSLQPTTRAVIRRNESNIQQSQRY
ncbi:hypothetical protein C6P45_000030 [Maudiozyma exigua]|uniref:Uncharacterized protein n=1 Tax=Maudiozyma exigua TaxID=34358 RepID=A0A9P7BBR2_MAUEX|nr:hypothetical protein C6P45_000030 [Kazachstania exigua]